MNVFRQLPNVLTSLNLATGVAGIINVFTGDYHNTFYFLLIAGLFDFFDGFAARLLKSDGAFGRELDSLADLVTFGVLPSIYLFQMGVQAGYHPWIPYLSILVAVFSAVRLAVFNLSDDQSQSFRGLPTPANAIMITTLGIFEILYSQVFVYVLLILISTFLLVAPITMMALKFKTFRFNENRYRYLLIILVIFSVLVFGFGGLPYLIPSYILISIISNFDRRFLMGK